MVRMLYKTITDFQSFCNNLSEYKKFKYVVDYAEI